MGSVLLVLVVVLVVAALVFGVVALLSGDDPGMTSAEPDGRAVPLPANRPLAEGDLTAVRFDTALRGYRMEQVDRALRRAAYDVGYKDEMIAVLEAEVIALREGREEDAELLRKARESAAATAPAEAGAEIEVGQVLLGPAGEHGPNEHGPSEQGPREHRPGKHQAGERAPGERVADEPDDVVDAGDAVPLRVPSRFGKPVRADEAAEEPARRTHG